MSIPSRPRAAIVRNFRFLVSFANSEADIANPYGCEDFKTFAEAEQFIRTNFFNNEFMQEKGVYIISTYDKTTDIVIKDICTCRWSNNQLVESF